MANIGAKAMPNLSYKERCEATAHMALNVWTASELKSMLERKGVSASTSIKEVRNFIRTKFPGLSRDEEESLIKNNVFQCEVG